MLTTPLTSVPLSMSKYGKERRAELGIGSQPVLRKEQLPQRCGSQQITALRLHDDEGGMHRDEALVDPVAGREHVAARFGRRRCLGLHRQEGHQQDTGDEGHGGDHTAGSLLEAGEDVGEQGGHGPSPRDSVLSGTVRFAGGHRRRRPALDNV